VFIDADKPASAGIAETFLAMGGQILTWRDGLTLEDELFRHLNLNAIDSLMAKATELVGAELMDQHIKTRSEGRVTLNDVETERLLTGYSPETRLLLGAASRIRNNGWFKSLSCYQEIALNIVGPALPDAEPLFKETANRLWGFTSAV
jgi:hypothetical protein